MHYPGVKLMAWFLLTPILWTLIGHSPPQTLPRGDFLNLHLCHRPQVLVTVCQRNQSYTAKNSSLLNNRHLSHNCPQRAILTPRSYSKSPPYHFTQVCIWKRQCDSNVKRQLINQRIAPPLESRAHTLQFPGAHTYHNHRWAGRLCLSTSTAKWFQIPGQSLNIRTVWLISPNKPHENDLRLPVSGDCLADPPLTGKPPKLLVSEHLQNISTKGKAGYI